MDPEICCSIYFVGKGGGEQGGRGILYRGLHREATPEREGKAFAVAVFGILKSHQRNGR